MLDAETQAILDQVETVEITTRGRTSGQPRRIEIWMYAINGRYIITGTPGPRDWYANVMTHPHLTLHLPNGIDLEAAVVPIDDRAFRKQVFTSPKTWWYRDQTPVENLIANSPMIEMHFE